MSDVMRAMPFDKLMKQALEEYRQKKSIFDVKAIAVNTGEKTLEFCGGELENPLGIAAGPHTQLAQNLLACYAGGARFLELKTVQVMYGEELGIPRPCIRANDEGYNVEWSSEFFTEDAMNEYIKAWVATKVIAKEFGLGNPDYFEYNMSVGYNLAGIQSKPVDDFLNGLNDATETKCFKECIDYLLNHLDLFENVDADYIRGISPKIAKSVSLSTMHGCPAEEIESIAKHLLVNKKFNTFVKCNPTLLGYDYVRSILDDMGYDYLVIDKHQFEVDLKIDEAVRMIANLQEAAKENNVIFGVKLSNTMPVEIKHDELPGNTMYMSGKSLYPLTISLARLLREKMGEDLEISYSGGADKNNIVDIFNAGIYPITICTTILQPSGYEKIKGLHDLLWKEAYPTERKVSLEKLEALVAGLRSNKNYCKSEVQRKKTDEHIAYRGVAQEDKLSCKVLCQSCIKVCPNRANTYIETEGAKWILHIDDACNECGNCQFFCVEPCRPYKDRLTLFADLGMMENSTNKGLLYDGTAYYVRVDKEIEKYMYEDLPVFMKEVVDSIRKTHAYLL